MRVQPVQLSYALEAELVARLGRQIDMADGRYHVVLGIGRAGTLVATQLAFLLQYSWPHVLTCAVRNFSQPGELHPTPPTVVEFPEVSRLRNRRVLVVDEQLNEPVLQAVLEELTNAAPALVHVAVLHCRPNFDQPFECPPDFRVETIMEPIIYPWEET